jgi:hypothetical protein
LRKEQETRLSVLRKLGRVDRPLVYLFCAFAAIRVFAYAAAFPLFNNVDELVHFDLVMKYSRGQVPHALTPISPTSAHLIALYASPEYAMKPRQYADGRIPPPHWTQPAGNVADAVDKEAASLEAVVNHEASQPPVYYAIAALWMRAGEPLFSTGGLLIYWTRFLNVFLAAALVWVAYVASASLFPANRFVRLGVPLLVALIPQDTYYGIQSDVLSPLCFGLAFVGMIGFLRAEVPGVRQAILTGLAVATICLVKSSNLPLLAVVAVTMLLKVRRLFRSGSLSAAAAPLGWFLLCAFGPVIVWLGWNLSNFGDLTGNAPKIQLLGWAYRPVAVWLEHPMFSPGGALTFWSELMASFWRGEFVWGGERMALPSADAFYWLSSMLLIGVAVVGLASRSHRPGESETRMLWFGFWSFASLVVFLGVLSVIFDFGKSLYPSQQHPFFTSGRLLGAALIPFALLYVFGLDRALCRWKSERLRFLVLVAIVLLMTISEIAVNEPAFASEYNWFHMLRWRQ